MTPNRVRTFEDEFTFMDVFIIKSANSSNELELKSHDADQYTATIRNGSALQASVG
jgi:hypothetical protein